MKRRSRIIEEKTKRGAALATENPCAAPCFCFSDASSLCAAVQALYRLRPALTAGLSLSGGRYYLAVQAPLRDRQVVRRVAPGCCIGSAPVLYAYRREHGAELSKNAIHELGRPLAN